MAVQETQQDIQARTQAQDDNIIKQGHTMQTRNLSAFYNDTAKAVEGVNLTFQPNKVTALIGPSGCGKSTLIRCLNRMHEVVRGARVEGEVLLNDDNIYAPTADPVRIRRRIGMVFQKPNPFPTMSIYDNVISGYKLNGGRLSKSVSDEIVEVSLRSVALWDEVKDKLKNSGTDLSGGQQQRLCIARTIAIEPEIVLLDEPCSALDPISTLKVEELIVELKRQFTIVLVTHNMQQAQRVADYTAFMLAGEERIGRMVEYGTTEQIFNNPQEKQTADYISGRFG